MGVFKYYNSIEKKKNGRYAIHKVFKDDFGEYPPSGLLDRFCTACDAISSGSSSSFESNLIDMWNIVGNNSAKFSVCIGALLGFCMKNQYTVRPGYDWAISVLEIYISKYCPGYF